jgi:two-component system chemotaxis response regulator CheV
MSGGSLSPLWMTRRAIRRGAQVIDRCADYWCMSKSSNGGVLESNRLAGTRLELLLFRLSGRQQFGINVFKVQEVIPYQQLTRIPGAHPLVEGVATLRGMTMSILDLCKAIGGPAIQNPKTGHIIITEYNRSVHGFLVNSVERIVNTRWEEVLPRPSGVGKNSYVTAMTLIDGNMIEILDVEKVLDQVVKASTQVSSELSSKVHGELGRVLVVDDSSVARKQITRALEQVGIQCITAEDGRKALELLNALAAEGIKIDEHFFMIISDIEMPEMDGYMLTTAIRANPAFGVPYILLHSSISGVFNIDMVKKTGANKFIQKYCADDLAQAVLERV